MRAFFGSVYANINRAVSSKGLYIAVFGTFLVICLGVSGLLSDGGDVIFLLGMAINGSSAILLIVCVFPTLALSTTFATDWNEASFRPWMIRTGIRAYVWAKILVCAISGFVATFLGIALFVVVFSFARPLFLKVQAFNAYSGLLQLGRVYSYLLLFITHISLSSSIFAVLALFASAYFQNSYTAVAMPVVIYMFAVRLSEAVRPPAFLSLSTVIETAYNAGSPLRSIALKLLLTGGAILVLGRLTFTRIRRLVYND